MILTIGMIVKNEEKHLRSCLEAITPILNQVDSELIIADTGSTDSSLEIAKSFTDNVFHFEWCDDFSAARNSTLERAQGEWYMFLDADEIFEDVSGIITFINSGEYKKYNSATYIIRSFNNENRAVYSDYDSFRLTKVSEDTRYTNRIHEALPLHKPTKKLSSLANHHGYLTENNKEFIEKKLQRNLKLLFLELEKDPDNCKYYLEIGQAYSLAGNLVSALEYNVKGLQYAKVQKHTLLNALYADVVHIQCEMKHFSDALSVTEEYFGTKKSKSEIDLQMYFLQATSNLELKKYKEAIVSYKKYIGFFKEYHQGRYRTKDTLQHVVKFTDQYNFRIACMNLVFSFLMEKDYISARQFLKLIPISDWGDDEINIKKTLAFELKLMEETEDYSQLTVLFKQLNEKSLIWMQTMIEPLLGNEAKRDLILTEIATSDLFQTGYIKLLKLRYDFFCKHSLTTQMVENFIREIGEWTSLYADVIYFALYYGLDISFVASEINTYDLDQLLFSSKFLHFRDLPQLIYKTFERNIKYKDTNSQLWLSSLYMRALCSSQLTKEQTIRLFHAFTGTISAYMAAVYKEEFLKEENICLLPKNLRVGYYCSLAVSSLNSGESSKYIEYLKIVIKLYPQFKHVIQILLEDFQKSLDEANRTADLSEFEKYAAVVKENINKLISAGNLNQAAEILLSYEQLCPADSEIAILKKQLETLARA